MSDFHLILQILTKTSVKKYIETLDTYIEYVLGEDLPIFKVESL